MKTIIYDIIGVGIGPFNLGLAALATEIEHLTTLFFDKNESINWHAGMMLDAARLQVPFHADLVTQVDPRSRFSFLSYLKAVKRLYRFTILEEYFPLRKEYNDYLRWVAGSLDSLRFGCRCTSVHYDHARQTYQIKISSNGNAPDTYYAKHLVIGIGTVPHVPECVEGTGNMDIFHSSAYLQKKECLKSKQHITIVGSGQSAAEIFNDLVHDCFHKDVKLSWFTGSPRFYPMDYSKFALELTSPDYIDYFYRLSPEIKDKILSGQSGLYKGMNMSLIDSIYNQLYELSLEPSFRDKIRLQANCQLQKVISGNDVIQCFFKQKEKKKDFIMDTDALILATGYHNVVPSFVEPIKERINWDKRRRYKVNRNYSIDDSNSIFVQNAESHTHGFNAPDLGMGPYRNAVIINAILGYEHFQTESDVPFQTLG